MAPVSAVRRRAAVAVLLALTVVSRLAVGQTVVDGSQRQDYLTPELRAAVERLKRDVATDSTTADTINDRAGVLWRWANAYALDGGLLPVELPLTVAQVRAFPGNAATTQVRAARIDRYVRELQVRDEQPDAIGTLASDVSVPFEAESYQTIRQTYTVGRMPMVAGGGIMVAKHFIADHGSFQTDDPAADNYVTVESSNSQARFVAGSLPVSGMHGGLFTPVETLIFRLEGTDLEPDDTISVTYGDRSGGSRGFRVQSYSNERFPLPLYVDLEGKGNYFSLPIAPYRVVGKGVHAVHGFAPSVVATGETFEVSVRSEDVYYNRATGPIPAYDVYVNDRLLRTIPAGDRAITVLPDLRFDEPGVYRFRFQSPDGMVTGEANPVWVRDNPPRRIYWGDTHGHSGFAEGQGTPKAFFEFGRDEARLDFLTHSEHDLWMDDFEWAQLKSNVKKYNEEGRFIAILGYEWTVRAERGGHHNVFFRTPEGRQRVPLQEAPVLSELYRRLATENDMNDVLIIPHAHEPGDYRHSHPQMESLVEIMSMHGRHEWFGIMYLRHGHQVGFVAASDDHLSHPGYVTPTVRGLADSGGLAAVMAPEKTTNAIFDALKNLDAYATTGDRIIVDLELNGTTMGQRMQYTDVRTLRGRVIGTAPIDSITVVKNGHDLWTAEYLEPENGSTQYAQVRFASPSDPVIRDSPRGWRLWTGTLEVAGAKLLSVTAPSLYNRRSEWARLDPARPGFVRFSAITRGSEKAIILELADAGPDVAIEVKLEPTVERPSTPSRLRPPAQIPGARFTLRSSDADVGDARKSFDVDRHTDTVMLRYIDPRAPREQSFDFTDRDHPDHGDYYYVRVKQLNGAMAWSSPIWVGGDPPD